jgi:hypothetical protein
MVVCATSHWTHNHSSLLASSFQACAVITIHVQLLSSNKMALTTAARTLLFLGFIFTTFGIVLAFILLQLWNPFMRSLARSHLIKLPAVLILMGLAGFVAVITIEAFKVSLGTGMTLIGILLSGIFLCLLALLFGGGGVVSDLFA